MKLHSSPLRTRWALFPYHDGFSLVKPQNTSNSTSTKSLLRTTGPDSLPQDGDTPIHVAVSWGQGEVIDLLQQRGGSLTGKNNAGLTPLDLAAPDFKSFLSTIAGLSGHDTSRFARLSSRDGEDTIRRKLQV